MARMVDILYNSSTNLLRFQCPEALAEVKFNHLGIHQEPRKRGEEGVNEYTSTDLKNMQVRFLFHESSALHNLT